MSPASAWSSFHGDDFFADASDSLVAADEAMAWVAERLCREEKQKD